MHRDDAIYLGDAVVGLVEQNFRHSFDGDGEGDNSVFTTWISSAVAASGAQWAKYRVARLTK